MTVKLLEGDCLQILPTLPIESVHLVLTDLPWNVSQDLKIGRSDTKDTNLDYGKWDHFDSESDYWKFVFKWLRESVRVLKPKGHLVTFFDHKRTSYLITYAKSLDLRFRTMLYWRKTNPVIQFRGTNFERAIETAVWFTKGDWSGATFNSDLGQQANVVDAALPLHDRRHTTQKPVNVLKVWIRYLSNEGDIILDPFMGSGSTIEAAFLLGRSAIGIEKDPTIFESASKYLSSIAAVGTNSLSSAYGGITPS